MGIEVMKLEGEDPLDHLVHPESVHLLEFSPFKCGLFTVR